MPGSETGAGGSTLLWMTGGHRASSRSHKSYLSIGVRHILLLVTALYLSECTSFLLPGNHKVHSYIKPIDAVASQEKMPSQDANCRHLYGYGKPDHVPSILQKITSQRRQDVADARAIVSEEELQARIARMDSEHGRPLNLFDRLRAEKRPMALAAEFKRASPSKGDIAPDLVASEQAVKYASVGAAILSVLTEPKWFKGTLDDMRDVRVATNQGFSGCTRPAVLRKDFIIDEYQVLEARAYGADTLLLIVAILEVDRLHALIKCSRENGLEPLVEVNTLEEMDIALDAGAKVIGVNNRNLHTFKLDLGTTERVMEAAKKRGLSWDRKSGDILLAALSGISSRGDVQRYEEAGVAAVLIGETLMRAPDPTAMIHELLGLDGATGRTGKDVLVKVCGVTKAEDALAAVRASANLIGTIYCTSKRQVDAVQGKAIVDAIRAFGERSDRVLQYSETGAGGGPLSPAWFEHWRAEILRLSRRRPLTVGVFQNQALEEVTGLVNASGVDLVQLHGDEGMDFAASLSRATGVPCIKVVHVPHDCTADAAGVERVVGEALRPGKLGGGPVAILLDTSVGASRGGSGQRFDLSVAQAVQQRGFPVVVAGGLSAENVEDVVKAAKPFGVDVSGGVEASPGVKDHTKLAEFLSRVRALGPLN